MGCDISKIRDELISELYSSGISPKAILAHKKNIEKYIYELKMTAELIETENKDNEINESKDTINIYSTEKNGYESLSNLSPREFTYDGKQYHSVEHAYQTLKSGIFNDKIFKAYNDKFNAGQKLGKISDPNSKVDMQNSYDLMVDLITTSLEQNEDARKLLLSTGNVKITHAQEKGRWGELFPDALMEARDYLKRNNFSEQSDENVNSSIYSKTINVGDNRSIKVVKADYDIGLASLMIEKEFSDLNDEKIKSNKKNQYAIAYGPIDYSYTAGSRTITHKSRPIPSFLSGLVRNIENDLGKEVGYYNHILLNKFDGTGIGTHTDRESIYEKEDKTIGSVAVYSIGSTKGMHVFGKNKVEVKADSGSIIEMSSGDISHFVSDADGTRYSVTLRHIPKNVLKQNTISGSGPKEWRSDENVTEKFNFGYQEIGEFIDTLVKATGDMTARTDSTGYHQNLKTLVDLIKDSMSENNFKKAIEIVGINTNDEFSNATYEENTDKDAKALNHSGEEMNLGGRLTIRYGKDYKEEMKDESGSPLDSYKNTFSGFRELVLHEVLHAMIDEAMNLDKELYAKVSAIQKQYAKKITLESMSKSMKARSGEEPTANNLMQIKDIVEYLNASPVEFLTYTMTNPIVYDIMESDTEAAKIDLVDSRTRGRDSDKKNAFQKIMDTIINIINKVYTIKTFGSKIKDGKVQPKTGLDMIQELTVELMLKNIALEKINSGFRAKIADGAIFGNYDLGGALNISSKYKKFDEQIKEIGGKAFKKMLDKKDSSGLTGKLEQTASWFNKFDFIKDQKENGNIRIFSDIMNTIVEDTTSEDGGAASFYQLIRNIKKNRDNGKVEMTQVARNKVDYLWKDMSKEQRESATFMLQADWKGLGLTLDEYANIVNDDSAIDSEIDKLKKEINVVEYNEGAKHLGFYIVHGVSKSPELMRNADMIFNRAYDSKRRTLVNPKFEKQYVEKIDKLASYYALKYMDKNIRKEIASSIAKDKELVEATSNMYYSYYDKQADKFRETGLHKYMEKGGMRKSSEVDMKFEVLPEDKIRRGRFTAHDEVRFDKATTDAMNDGKDYWLVASRDFSPSRTQGGFDDIHIIDKGLGLRSIIGGNELITHDAEFDSFINKRIEKAPHFLNKEHDDSLESMIALDNQLVAAFDIYGNVIDYEVPISELDRKDKGRLNNDIASTLSQTISHIHSKENAVKNNGVFAKMLVQESDNNAGKPGYVFLRPSTIDEIKSGNKHKYDEEWAMIPNYIQKMILARDSNGNNTRDGLWVKEGRINNIIGYKDMTIANLKMFGKDLNEYPAMQRALQVIEYFWKQMSSRYKEIVVKLFPAVVWANITSNMWVAMRHGIGPMEYAKGFVRNWTNLTTYLELSEELIKAQLDLDSGVVKTDAKILELKKQMKNNSFHRLIEDGQFNSIMEDLDSTGLTKKSHIEDYFDIAAKKGGKLGGQIKTVVENLYIGRNTAIHKNIEKLTVFNDIINRSIIMERMMQDLDSIDGLEPEFKNAKIQDILNYVDQLFVNYSYLDNKVVKYLNDVNLVTFTKYFFRALKANISMMSRYPLASLGFEGYDEFIYDVSDSLDQYGNPIDSFMNRVIVTPVEVASELIIPNSIGIFIR